MNILELLPVGEAEAVPTKELVKILHTDERTLRHDVELLRREGHVICASNRGLYRPESREESRKWIRTTRKRAISLLEACESAEKALEDVPGQTKLELEQIGGN